MRAPTPEEMKEFLAKNGYTHQSAAEAVHLAGGSTIRKYLGGKKPTTVPYAVWFTLHAKALLPVKVVREIEAAMVEDAG